MVIAIYLGSHYLKMPSALASLEANNGTLLIRLSEQEPTRAA